MLPFIKGVLGIGSIILGGWVLGESINENSNNCFSEEEVIYDFEDEYYDIPREQRFNPNEYEDY